MISSFTLSNGLSVLVEEMSHVESASYDLLIPGGYVCDPADKVGAGLILAELIGRGAGPLDSRELSEQFDALGIRHGEGVGTDRYGLSGSLVSDALPHALQLVSYMVTSPRLPEGDIPNIQSVLLQDIESLSDNPARRSMIELTKRYYPGPYNRPSLGEADGIRASSRESLLALYKECFGPSKAILSIAGKVDSQSVRQQVERLFGAWEGGSAEIPSFGAMPKNEYFHIPYESSQLQIVVASPSVRFNDVGYYAGKIAVSLLGASMFGRLFVELREKRGLCYSVYARHGSTMSYGTVTAYVGTTPERAQESLDVLVEEMRRLRGTATADELERAKTNLKAALVMGEESPGARAASNATDWWFLKRVRPLSEINKEIDKVSLDSVNEFLDMYPFQPASLLTLGNRELKVPAGLIKGDV
jgi:predicted Zn-dependent peptidase